VNTKPLPACGTVHAYWRHKRLKQDPDQLCIDAWRAYLRNYRAGALPPRRLAPCGTDSGYSRHRSRNEPACQACLEAHAAHNRLDHQAARLAAAIFNETGT
jgi:hypothetical protein